MFVDGIGEVPLHDTGGFPVVWIDGVGPGQDPNQGGTNVYGPGDVLDDDAGNMYQIGSDFHIRPFGTPAPSGGNTVNPATHQPPNAPAAAPPPQIVVNIGDAITKALQSQAPQSSAPAPAAPARTTNAANAPGRTDPNVRAATGTASTLTTFFSQQLRLGQGFSVPYWLLGAGGLLILSRRRRHR